MDYTARDVKVEYIIGGVFYLISYSIGEGEPFGDFDFEIPGLRGGTHKTRYYGHLEGVKEDTIKLAKIAINKKEVSMHSWLDDIIKKEALKIINKNEKA